MSVIKKLIAGMSLATLLVSLGGCLPFMAVRAAKTVSGKANSSSDADADAKKAQDANKPAGSATAPATAAPAATPAK